MHRLPFNDSWLCVSQIFLKAFKLKRSIGIQSLESAARIIVADCWYQRPLEFEVLPITIGLTKD
jgi:hypothetical protein